ncbi:hypothetical protein DFJ58DRAFT_840340 [Suillus subalutaceus]|uniref:uncharacterized protein n=1 Tax=Suillus subalutaceus TaxID=48586 RepID=UPI001B871E4B|nr:uncharacterized protein DFJ58DRAFT_840340 [Suillus subalutaceus]KAG1858747.1 hypothetical protein DFJ58DRAFT_840340 [Suillus subalutaceus]
MTAKPRTVNLQSISVMVRIFAQRKTRTHQNLSTIQMVPTSPSSSWSSSEAQKILIFSVYDVDHSSSVPPHDLFQSWTTDDAAGWGRVLLFLLSLGQRGAALGETPLPSAPRSLNPYCLPRSHTLSPMSHKLPYMDFEPFMTDPSKQTRYAAYLRACKSWLRRNSTRTEARADTRGVRKRDKQLCKPWLGGLRVPLFWIEGLHTPAAQPKVGADSMDVTEETPREEVKEEAPKAHTARLRMYGAVMCEVCTWQPARLLCKCFEVKVPVLGVPVDTSGLTKPISETYLSAESPVYILKRYKSILLALDGILVDLTRQPSISHGGLSVLPSNIKLEAPISFVRLPYLSSALQY